MWTHLTFPTCPLCAHTQLGDIISAGGAYGKIRVLKDDLGKNLESAGASVPVQVVGLSTTPMVSDCREGGQTCGQAVGLDTFAMVGACRGGIRRGGGGGADARAGHVSISV